MRKSGQVVLAAALVIGGWLGWRLVAAPGGTAGPGGAQMLARPGAPAEFPARPDDTSAERIAPLRPEVTASSRIIPAGVVETRTPSQQEVPPDVVSATPSASTIAVDTPLDSLDAESDWPPPPVGSITGSLVPDSGVFAGDAAALIRGITLDLVSREAPHVKRVAKLTPVLDAEGQLVRIDFAADELPGLEFELTLSTLDRCRWYPETTLVLPPAGGVEFRCFDDDPKVELLFEVVDAATGEAIDDWSAQQFRMSVSPENGVLLHAGPLTTEAFPASSSLEWVVESEGYAPAFGNERAFRVDSESGAWRTRVELDRGHAFRLVVLAPDPELRPAAGAAVVLDGAAVGTTDSTGQLVVRGKQPPETVGIEWRNLGASGPLDEICLPRRSYLRVALLRE